MKKLNSPLTSQETLDKIKKVFETNLSNIAKIIEIEYIIKEEFIIDENEDIPELKDPEKHNINEIEITK